MYPPYGVHVCSGLPVGVRAINLVPGVACPFCEAPKVYEEPAPPSCEEESCAEPCAEAPEEKEGGDCISLLRTLLRCAYLDGRTVEVELKALGHSFRVKIED